MDTLKATIPRKRLVMVVSLTTFLLALAGGAYLLHASQTNSPHKLSQGRVLDTATKGVSSSSANPTMNSQANQVKVTPTPISLPPKQGENSYVSQSNRVGFYYSPNSGSVGFGVKEAGNKITLFRKDKPGISQYLELLTKSPSDTIQQAITKDVLNGYSLKDCPISDTTSQSGYPSNIEIAMINYSSDNQIQGGWGIADTSKCPVQYTVNFDTKYFLMDKNFPNKLLFFNLGQFLIPAGQSQSWQNTITQF